jgi:hypothetical protein
MMKIICISLMWSAFIFIGYNILTAEATVVPNEALGSTTTEEKEAVDLNKEYTWTGPDGHKDKVTLNDFELEDIPHTCDASEDYDRNEKLCNALYKMEEESKIKDACNKMDGKWKDSECKFEKDGLEMGKPYSKEQYQVDFDHYLSDKGLGEAYLDGIAEKAAQEDAICDNEDADYTNIKLCMSEEREKDIQNTEEACDYVGAKMTKDNLCDVDDTEYVEFDEKYEELNNKEDKQAIQKEMCEVNYEAKWKDGECQFPYQKGPVNERLEYQEDLADVDKGVYDDYAERNNLKEKQLKQLVNDDDENNINRENVDYFCDASEDYEANKKSCDKLYDKVNKQEEAEEQEKQEREDSLPKNKISSPYFMSPVKEESEEQEQQQEEDSPPPPPTKNKLSPYYYSTPVEEEQKISEEEEEELPNVLASPIITKIDDEVKRYENPDGGAPLYEDELTEDEKDDYTEYKPEKEEGQQQIEDWSNTVTTNNEVKEENDEPTTDDENNTEEINDDGPEEEEESDDNSEEEQEESDDSGEDESSEE